MTTHLYMICLCFDKSLSPEWLGIDLNNDKKISKEEPIFYPEQNTKKINLPITLYANRIKKTDNSSKIGHDLEVNFTKTKINFISNNNSIPSRIFAKNFFTKKEFEVKQLKNNNGVMLSKFNKIIFSTEQAKPVENLGGKIFVNKDLIFNSKVSIMPGQFLK